MKQNNDHLRAQALFSAFIDHQTTADEKKFVERHLAVCDQDCRAVLAQTRSMISSTRSLPLVKAPRSFVLPKSMARQPARSIFAWYPALRLATSIAVIAFVVVFAGDLFSQRSVMLSANVPSAANAPQLSAAPQPTTVALYAAPPESATIAQAPAAPQTGAGILPTPTTTAMAAADAAAIARSAMTLTDQTITATLMTTAEVAMAATPIEPPIADAAPKVVTSAVPAANQVGAIEQTAAPALDPLHMIEIFLAVLVLLLGAVTLIARRRARA